MFTSVTEAKCMVRFRYKISHKVIMILKQVCICLSDKVSYSYKDTYITLTYRQLKMHVHCMILHFRKQRNAVVYLCMLTIGYNQNVLLKYVILLHFGLHKGQHKFTSYDINMKKHNVLAVRSCSTSQAVHKCCRSHLHGYVSEGVPESSPGAPHHAIVMLRSILASSIKFAIQVGRMAPE